MAMTIRASLPTAAPRLTSCETSAALRMTGRASAGSGAKEIDMGRGAMTEAAERAILPAYACHPKFIFVICRMTADRTRMAPRLALLSLAPISPLESRDIELDHAHHCAHDPRRLLRIRVLKHFSEHHGHDLPRHTELVFNPAALLRLAAFAEPDPQFIYFFLSLAVDEKRDSGRKGEHRAAVQRFELPALQFECNAHDRALRPRASVAETHHRQDSRVIKDARVELSGFLRVVVEP